MNNNILNIILLQGLPASGKSSIKKYWSNTKSEILKGKYHIGETIFLDDFIYVRFMHLIDNELENIGQKRFFYPGDEPFYDGRDWGTLCKLLNEDYSNLINKKSVSADSASRYLFERIDKAALQVGIQPRLRKLDDKVRSIIEKKLEVEASKILKRLDKANNLANTTIIIEYSRGGADGVTMPLSGTSGYQYSLPLFCRDILRSAAILYVWTTPDESRKKNARRFDLNTTHPNLDHDIPLSVMLSNYGTDDMDYLIKVSGLNDTITVNAYGESFNIPVGVFDNRKDKTDFLRLGPDSWQEDEVKQFEMELQKAIDVMYINHYE